MSPCDPPGTSHQEQTGALSLPAGQIVAHIARRAVTMIPEAGPLDDAAVIARGNVILEVGPRRAVLKGFSGTILDHGPATLMPGLINAHCHIGLAHLRGAIPPGLGFTGWVRCLLSLPMARFDEAAVGAAAREMVGSGIVCVADIAARHPGLAARALAREGLGGTVFFEAFGYTPPPGPEPDWPADLAGWDVPLDHAPCSGSPGSPGSAGSPGSTASPGLPDLPESPDRPDISLAGHALYSTHPERLRAAKAWTARHGKPFSLHLAEHEGEVALLADGTGEFAELLRQRVLPAGYRPPGRSPVAQAEALGLLDARTLAVHVVHVDDADIRILIERGCGVCLCPRSNAFIGVGRAPWEKLASAGARLCLGTDSPASNTDLDLWNEVRYLLKHGKGFSLTAALAALTTTPARVLGREKTMGMLAPGMHSGVTLLPGDLVGA